MNEQLVSGNYTVNAEGCIAEARSLGSKEGIQKLRDLFGFDEREAFQMYFGTCTYICQGETILDVNWRP